MLPDEFSAECAAQSFGSPIDSDRSVLSPDSGQEPLKAITVVQPWAWAFFYADPPKDVENRSWPLPQSLLGRRVAIHASSRRDRNEWDHLRLVMNKLNGFSVNPPSLEAMEEQGMFSSILGTVEVTDCARTSKSPWFFGPYGFSVRDPRPLAVPLVCRGRLGFWTVTDALAREIRAQEERAA